MQVILLEHIRKLGKLGDLVEVKAGFARNFLIPKGKADAATKINLAKFEERRKELEEKANSLLTESKHQAEVLNELTITVQALASEEGTLFGSIGVAEISQAIVDKTKLNISKQDISLPDGAIHSIGESEVDIILQGDISAKITLIVEAKDTNK